MGQGEIGWIREEKAKSLIYGWIGLGHFLPKLGKQS